MNSELRIPNSKLLLGLVGEMAAGKTTATNYLKEKYGAVSFRFSDMLRDMLRRLHLPETRENLQKLSTALRQAFGDDIMSTVMKEDMASADAPVLIIEGIRRPSDVAMFSGMPNFHLLAIAADARTRYERITNRSENPDDRGKTWEEFQKEILQEAEQKIGDIAAKAEIVLQNHGTKEALFSEIENALRKLQS